MKFDFRRSRNISVMENYQQKWNRDHAQITEYQSALAGGRSADAAVTPQAVQTRLRSLRLLSHRAKNIFYYFCPLFLFLISVFCPQMQNANCKAKKLRPGRDRAEGGTEANISRQVAMIHVPLIQGPTIQGATMRSLFRRARGNGNGMP